ncbi:MAG: hydroxyethylthiazole kinase [Chlamydiales bacterium]|nr:hydroxyethylthiazole kinase [Chlamydiales bacterium]
MKVDPHSIWSDIQKIKSNSPLVHNITNYVVMEQTANSLLALGASPVMAHALEEVEDMTMIASSLVLNIGTLSSPWVSSMLLAIKTANRKGIPVVFDPVGAGATQYRTKTANTIIAHGIITAIRGNASEIVSLCNVQGMTKGVDTSLNPMEHVQQAKLLASRKRCIVWMSGKSDIITDGESCIFVHNGHPLMEKVTGMGCGATAIAGAFLAINPNAFLGLVHAAILISISGEIAARRSNGPGSFIPLFMDTLYSISLAEIEEYICVEYYE